MHDLNNKLIWLMAIRVLVILSVLLPNLITPVGGEGSEFVRMAEALVEMAFDIEPEPGEDRTRPGRQPENQVFQLLVAIVSIQTLIYVALSRLLRHRSEIHAYVQLAGDLFLITLLIYKFGRPTANLSILYFVIISAACFLVRRQAGLVVATAACALYASVVFFHSSDPFYDLWKPPGPFAVAAPLENITGEAPTLSWLDRTLLFLRPPSIEDVSGVPMTYSLTVHLLGFYAVAFFAAYLARDQALERKLEQRSLDLAYLKVLYRDVIQSISSGLAVTDLEGITTSLNHPGERILGLDERQLIGSHISETGLFTLEGWEELTQRSDDGMLRDEGEIEREDGTPAYLGFSLTRLHDGEGTHRGYILIFQDLSDWRRLQEQVRIQDRMAAIGQMAAGLAHEVGNPLAAISGSVQMLARNVDRSTSQAKLLDITLKESRRLDRTVKAFLQFARPKGRHLEEFDIAEVLREDVQLLRNSDEVLPNHEIRLEVESLRINADLDQVGQLFWNLARNSLQAMPEGGTLEIGGRSTGGRYELRFQDSGRGMTEEERANLFQPFKSFFDSGTGLGMAIVYRIVEEHGGNIEVDSRPGAGTLIVVDIPIRPAQDESAVDVPAPERAAPRGETRA